MLSERWRPFAHRAQPQGQHEVDVGILAISEVVDGCGAMLFAGVTWWKPQW